MTPKPEAQVARFLVGMFRNRFLEARIDAKVSPKIVSPNKEAVLFLIVIFFLEMEYALSVTKLGWIKKCHQKYRLIN